MSMTAFLFAADALRIEEGWVFHVETPGQTGPPRTDPSVAARNAEAMSMLAGVLGGTRGAPKIRMPR